MSYGIWDVGRKKWMPDPLLGHMSRRPESFKTRGEAERTADREWRKLNPDVKFEVRPLPSTEESRRTRKPSAHEAGADYAHEQIGSPYFLEWVHEQMAEAERMRQADPNSVIDASTPAGARKVAKNMLQQLEWDTKRELNMTTVGLEHGDAKAFYEGFAEQLRQTSTVEWLTDIILRTEEDMRGAKHGVVHEAYGRRLGRAMRPRLTRASAKPGTHVRVAENNSMYRGWDGLIVTPDPGRSVQLGSHERKLLSEGAVLVERHDGKLFVVPASYLELADNETHEAYGRRRHPSDAVIKHKQYEEEWQRKSAEYRAKVEPLKTGLVRIVGGDELLRRGIQIPTSGVIVASLSDPRKYNEPVAHFRQYPDFGYGEDSGIGTTYYVEPALVPAGKETRETYDLPRAKQHRKGVDYYETASDAQKVRNHILPQYPEARVVRYELGWAVQLYKSGPYYPEPALVPVGAETREASGRCQLAWSRTTQASTATGAKGLFKVESKPDGWYVTLDGGKLGVYAERKGAERAAERFEADESIPARREAAEAPAGKEAREAREAKRTPTSTMYQEAQVFINGRFQVGFTFTPSRGPEAAAREVLSLTRDGDIIEVKQGQEVWTYKVAGKGNAKRLVPAGKETREAEPQDTLVTARRIARDSSGSEPHLLRALTDAGVLVLRAYPAPNYGLATDERRNLLQIHVRFPDGTMGYFAPGGPPRLWSYTFTAGTKPGDENLPGVSVSDIASVIVGDYSEMPTQHTGRRPVRRAREARSVAPYYSRKR